MARSLRRYGQIAPVVVCLREERPVLVDGFKRLAAARGLKGLEKLSARRIEVDERGAKAAMYGLNRIGRHFGELEEAWLVQALVREDGLSQVEVATLLGRHKSWVCRRLAMMEKLCAAGQEDLRLGLLSPTMARQLTRLPAGNQQEALETGRRHSLSAAELRGVVDLLLASGTQEKAAFVLERPRQALREVQAGEVRGWDPRSVRQGIASAATWRRCWTSWRGWQAGCGTAGVETWRYVIEAYWSRVSCVWRANRTRWLSRPRTL